MELAWIFNGVTPFGEDRDPERSVADVRIAQERDRGLLVGHDWYPVMSDRHVGAGEVGALFAKLAAVARPAGSVAESAARAHCRAWLEEDGFHVSDAPFSYSRWPGLYATPLFGFLLFTVAVFALIAVLRAPGEVALVMTWSSLAVALVAAIGLLVSRHGTSRLPWVRGSSTNLEAVRGDPAVWLLAHLDSKSQPVSLLARAAGAVLFSAAWAGSLAAWMLVDKSGQGTGSIAYFLSLCGLASVPLMLSAVGTRGDGALDNASGVAAVLVAARQWPAEVPIGVLITSGEELGLAGARAWAAGRPPGIVINCDGVDDSGAVTVTLGGGRADGTGKPWNFMTVRRVCGPEVRVRRILPGVLLDAVAMTDAGWEACTVSKGTLRSLARIHTRRDTLAGMAGTGIPEVAEKIVALGGAIIA